MFQRLLTLALAAQFLAVLGLATAPIEAETVSDRGAAPDSSSAEDPGFRLIVHHRNPVDSLSREQVAELFLLADQTWDGERPVEPVSQVAGTPIQAAFESFVHAKSAAAVQESWQKQEVAGRRSPPLVRDGDRAVVQWVRFHTEAIGYVSPAAVPAAGVKVVEITDEEDEDGEDKPSRISLVLDASGSMRAPVNGRSKLDIARDVLRQVLVDWDPEISLGMVVYGHRDGSCEDIETLVPVEHGGAGPVAAALEYIEAKGATPLTQAVVEAARDVASGGVENSAESVRVVLVSDGEETCGRNPCELHEEMESLGVGFTTYVVGFDILRNSKAQSQLRCLAQKSGGTFQLAWDSRSLARALRIALARATGEEPEEETVQVASEEPTERELDFRVQYVRAGEVEASRSSGERGQGESGSVVRVKEDFWITDTEITQGDWRLLMGANPSYFHACGDECPVERVNLFDAMVFANRLSEHEQRQACYRLGGCHGAPGSGCADGDSSCTDGFFCGFVALREGCDGYRLPSASEWRYAAQGDRSTAFWWGDELTPEDARCAYNSRDRRPGAEQVRSLPTNPFGLYEVHGNVGEWVRDAKPVAYSVETPDGDWQPRADASFFEEDPDLTWESRKKESAVGGSWSSSAASCQASGSGSLPAATRSHQVGLRLVRSAGR